MRIFRSCLRMVICDCLCKIQAEVFYREFSGAGTRGCIARDFLTSCSHPAEGVNAVSNNQKILDVGNAPGPSHFRRIMGHAPHSWPPLSGADRLVFYAGGPKRYSGCPSAAAPNCREKKGGGGGGGDLRVVDRDEGGGRPRIFIFWGSTGFGLLRGAGSCYRKSIAWPAGGTGRGKHEARSRFIQKWDLPGFENLRKKKTAFCQNRKSE